jgi:hypothetical protein
MPEQIPGHGKITSGIDSNTLVERTLEFVREELPKWRDDPERVTEKSEERLNAQLCKYLEVASRRHFPMIYFHHEEKQTGIRRVDVSALPSEGMFVGATYHSIYDPFIVFEGKRLPPPIDQPNRAREYVTGGKEKSGGIQRFKLGLHGAKHGIAAMVGYVQEGEPRDWFKNINCWICDLAKISALGEEKWVSEEQLVDFAEDVPKRIVRCSSLHPRTGEVVSNTIQLQHLWVDMK